MTATGGPVIVSALENGPSVGDTGPLGLQISLSGISFANAPSVFLEATATSVAGSYGGALTGAPGAERRRDRHHRRDRPGRFRHRDRVRRPRDHAGQSGAADIALGTSAVAPDVCVVSTSPVVAQARAAVAAGALAAGAGAAIAGNQVVDSIDALIGAAAVVDSPGQIGVLATGKQTLSTQVGSAAGGLGAGIAGSVGLNVLAARTWATVMPTACLNGAGTTNSLGAALCPLSTSITPKAGQRIDVLADSRDPSTTRLPARSAPGSLAGAGAGANVGLILKDTQALLGGTANSNTDIIVDAISKESVLGVLDRAQHRARRDGRRRRDRLRGRPADAGHHRPGLVHPRARTTSHVTAYDDGDLTMFSGGGGASLLASAGASVSAISVVKTTLAFIGAGATVSADGKGTGITGFTGQGRTTSTYHGLLVQAVSFQNLYTIALWGGAAAVTINLTAGGRHHPRVDRHARQDQPGDASDRPIAGAHRRHDEPGRKGLRAGRHVHARPVPDGLDLFIAGIGAAVDGGVIIKNTEGYIGPLAHVDSNGSIYVQAFSREIDISLSGARANSGLVGVAGAAGAYILTITTKAYIGLALPALPGVLPPIPGINSVIPTATAATGSLGSIGLPGVPSLPITLPSGAQLVNLAMQTPVAQLLTRVRAQGNVLVNAVEQSFVVLLTGALGTGLLSIGAAPHLAILTKVTDAQIGAASIVTANGQRGLVGVIARPAPVQRRRRVLDLVAVHAERPQLAEPELVVGQR